MQNPEALNVFKTKEKLATYTCIDGSNDNCTIVMDLEK